MASQNLQPISLSLHPNTQALTLVFRLADSNALITPSSSLQLSLSFSPEQEVFTERFPARQVSAGVSQPDLFTLVVPKGELPRSADGAKETAVKLHVWNGETLRGSWDFGSFLDNFVY